jgi:hypothetical protein
LFFASLKHLFLTETSGFEIPYCRIIIKIYISGFQDPDLTFVQLVRCISISTPTYTLAFLTLYIIDITGEVAFLTIYNMDITGEVAFLPLYNIDITGEVAF